jgi:hypothetical protein
LLLQWPHGLQCHALRRQKCRTPGCRRHCWMASSLS